MRRWLYSTNHKDIGLLYIITSLAFFLAAGSLALLVRLQLFSPNGTVLNASVFNQFVTVHGLLMILWVLSPLAIGFANYFIPLQIGARDLAFPRLNAMSYWFYLYGGIAMVLSFFFGSAPDIGWTLYSPQTSSRFSPFLGFNLGAAALVMLVASVTLSSVNFIVTILKMRAPGLKLKYLSPFTWAILVTVFMMLYAFPSLLAAVIMLFSDRAFGTIYFSSLEGGALLWDNVFWFFGHPEVYIVLFPAIGLVGDMLPTFTRRPLYGAKYIIISMIAAAVISFIVWGHHMFITGVAPQVTKLFTLTTIAVSLPFDVIVISMIETLVRARIRLKAPALFAIGSIALFVIGGITGVFLASVALDRELRGTYFVVAHFHYVMVGGAIMALIGGLYYWFPKMTGKMYDEKMARIHFILSFIGFNVLYFPMFLLLDMPRRIFTYPPRLAELNSIATIGAFVFGLAQILLFVNIWRSYKVGRPAGSNPWEGWTLEWAVPSPPPAYNFETIPRISEDGTVHLSGGTSHGIGNGYASHSTHLSQWPIVMALAAFLFLLGLTTSGTPPNLVLLVPGIVVGLGSLYGYGRETFVVQEDENLESWPFQHVSRLKLGIWTFLASEIIFFGVLIGAYLFVRLSPLTAQWPAVGTVFNIREGATNTFILLASSFTVVLAVLRARAGSRGGLVAGLLATLGLGAWFLYNKAIEWGELAVEGIFTSHPLAATSYYITTGVHGVHVFVGLALIAYLLANAVRGKYLGSAHATVQHFGLYWHFVDIVWVFLFPLFYLI